jgi:exopolysaccharide production protein ExoZ
MSNFLPQKNQLKTLQIVRALASTSVVYFHIGSVPCFGGIGSLPCFGGFGVDIFFVLSGFVMAMIIATGQSVSRFTISRVSRIVPLYWVLTTFVLVLAAFKPELLNSTTANLSNYLRSILFIPYFKENGTLMPMLFVGWSLNYEMVFYLCVALSLIISLNRSIFVATGLLAATYISLGYFAHSLVLNKFFGNELMYEFILGMLAFEVYNKGYFANVPTRVALATGVVGYVFMAVADSNAFHINRLLSYGVPSFIVISSAVRLENAISSVPHVVVNLFIGAGDASYATYLSHPYVTEAVRKILVLELHLFDINSPLGVAITLSITLMAGALIYRLIDRPLSQRCKALIEKLSMLLRNRLAPFRYRTAEVLTQ